MTDYRRRDDERLPRLEERVVALTDSLLLLRHAVADMDGRATENFRRMEERMDAAAWVTQQQFTASLQGYVTQRALVAWLLSVVGGMFVAVWGAIIAFGGTIISWLRAP